MCYFDTLIFLTETPNIQLKQISKFTLIIVIAHCMWIWTFETIAVIVGNIDSLYVSGTVPDRGQRVIAGPSFRKGNRSGDNNFLGNHWAHTGGNTKLKIHHYTPSRLRGAHPLKYHDNMRDLVLSAILFSDPLQWHCLSFWQNFVFICTKLCHTDRWLEDNFWCWQWFNFVKMTFLCFDVREKSFEISYV